MMTGLVLAGGFGTRLGKMGLEIPKGLINGHGSQTLLEKMLNELDEIAVIDKLAVVTNMRFCDKYREFLRQRKGNKKVLVMCNRAMQPEERLGAIGDLSLAINQ